MNSKLAYLCSSESWGGLEMNHLRNAQWMQERGHNVVVICISDTPIEKTAKDFGLATLTISKHKKYYDFKNAKKLISIIRSQNITHLLIRSTYDMSIAATVKRKLGDAIHTSYFMEMQLGVKKKGIGHTIRFKYIDSWSAPLHWLASQVKELTNYRNELTIIPSGIEIDLFKNNQTKEECRTELSLIKDVFTFGLIGRFDPQKGQLLLLEAMLKTNNKDYHVVLLGEPTMHEEDTYFEQMKHFISENNLSNRVHIRPYRKDTPTFYKAIDWLVMATKAETFGMVTIESLACGTRVLGSNAGGTVELLADSNNGMLFETLNAQSLADKIDQICANDESINHEHINSYVEKFDHSKVCTSVEKLLKLNTPL